MNTDSIQVKEDLFNKKIYISTGRNRRETKWKNTEITYETFIKRLEATTKTQETTNEYKNMAKAQRDEIKDVGGFVGGVLKNGKRNAENIANRSLITLDMDNVDIPVKDLWKQIKLLHDYETIMYSTHTHTPESPRLRLVIPLSRSVLPDEYQAISRKIAEGIGIDMFDDTTYEPCRLMYWPSTSSDGEYIFLRTDRDWLDPDTILNQYIDWRDVSLWPESSRQTKLIYGQMRKQEDPLNKKGIIGAFCRTYSIADVIEKYLSETYTPIKIGKRYTYTQGHTVGGLVLYDNKFAYSHHGTDPICQKLCNAFDLVRVHRFSLLDEEVNPDTPVNRLPSYLAMCELASNDTQVKVTLGTEKLNEAEADLKEMVNEIDNENDTNWLKALDYDNKGHLRNTIDNAVLILDNDPRIKGKLLYNAFSNRATIVGKLPWNDQINRDWSDDDNSGVRHFLEKHYHLTYASKIADAVTIVFQKHRIHPVKEYLDSLVWDGGKRVEMLLTDYLGAEDNIYTRAVIRNHLTAAVARVMNPGCKYDTMLILTGPQGIGKSTFIRLLGRDWFNDSLDTVTGKEAYELLQGSWLIEISELTATRKADIEAVKKFLSKNEDIYRVAYGRTTSRFQRQCVFWGTTNDRDILRDITGDRRAWPVDCGVVEAKKNIFKDLKDEVNQIWAEAVVLYRSGVKLHLEGEELEEALKQQANHSEDRPKAGLIEDYLNREYPVNWDNYPLDERLTYIHDHHKYPEGAHGQTIKKQKSCVMEIWCDLFKGDPKTLSPLMSREINDILRTMKGWKPSKSNLRFRDYGQQRAYIREQK